MLTGALYQSLWAPTPKLYHTVTGSPRRFESPSSFRPEGFSTPRRQTPYFKRHRSQCVFGPDDIFLSIFYFSVQQDSPNVTGEVNEATRSSERN